MTTDWMSVAQLAKVLGVDRVTVYRWITSGWLPAEKHGGRWEVDAAWIPWLRLWRNYQDRVATKAVGFRLTPELYDILTAWADQGEMTVQKAAVWLWMRGLQAEGRSPSTGAMPVLVDDPSVVTLIQERATAWGVDGQTAALWLMVRGMFRE
jgi:excisionase family DNA binding protein